MTTKKQGGAQASVDLSDLIGDILPFPSSNLAVALDLAKRGYAIFPCRGKDDAAGRVKAPLTANGFKAASTDEMKIRQWWNTWPDAIPALPAGERNGFAVLDLDRHKVDEDGIDAIRALGFDPDQLSPIIVDTAGGGVHIYLAPNEFARTASTHLPPGVDVRGEGGYVIAPGARLPDGREWRSRSPIASRSALKLPTWPQALLPPLPRVDLSDLLDEPRPVDWAKVKSALAAIPPSTGREEWIRVGMAIHAACSGGDEGFKLWDDWSARAPEVYRPREMSSQWRSFGRRDGVDIGTLFHVAASYGWTPIVEISPDDFEDLEPPADPKESRVSGGLTFLSPDECVSCEPRRYVIKGLLAERDVGCIVGAPGVGKSLLAPYLAYAVAQGRNVFGARVRQGSVLYVAAEDHHGMIGRIRALRDEHGTTEVDAFSLVGGVSDLLTKGSPNLKALLAAVKAKTPRLVVIDTLAMAFPGLEENSAEGMGRVVAVARALTRWGAAVLLVHHDTKDGQQGLPRGHSLLNGALDVAIHLKRDEDATVRGRLTKNRNGACDMPLAFSICVTKIGTDEDGDPIRVAFCRESSAAKRPAEYRLKKPERVVIAILKDIQPATREEWRDAAINDDALCSSPDKASRRKAFERALSDLSEKRLILRTADGYVCSDGMQPDPFDGLPDNGT